MTHRKKIRMIGLAAFSLAGVIMFTTSGATALQASVIHASVNTCSQIWIQEHEKDYRKDTKKVIEIQEYLKDSCELVDGEVPRLCVSKEMEMKKIELRTDAYEKCVGSARHA